MDENDQEARNKRTRTERSNSDVESYRDEEAQIVKNLMERDACAVMESIPKQKIKKITGIRDNTHRWIDQIDDLCCGLIDTNLMQRLRDITQTGCLSKVYPGATHTRFAHSIGAMHLARKYALHLTQHMKDDQPEKSRFAMICSAAALMHDIGHGPFSHSFDRAVYSKYYPDAKKGHDEHRKFLVRNDSQILAVLKRFNVSPEDIITAWTTSPYCEITQGEFGADRLDYIPRDALHCGLDKSFSTNPERIIADSYLTTHEDGSVHLAFSSKTQSERDAAQSVRKYMYSDVYCSKRVKYFDEIIEEIMKTGHIFNELIVNLKDGTETFARLNEPYFWHIVEGWAEVEPGIGVLRHAYFSRDKTLSMDDYRQ